MQILLVDDNIAEWRIIEEIVAGRSKAAPVSILTATNCKGALAFLSNRELTPNLVIADMDVLEFGGVELVKQCNPRGIPVVIFSGSMNPAHKAEALRLGAKQFVTKPMQLDEYVDAVWKMIANWATRSTASTAGAVYSSSMESIS